MAYGGGQRGALGEWGEEQACHFLIRQGFRVIDRNFHSTMGEIDIIARKGDDFYFIEVKTRHTGALATDQSITPSKIYKLRKTIKQYCYQKNISDGSPVLAGLLVIVDSYTKKVNFRLAVIY